MLGLRVYSVETLFEKLGNIALTQSKKKGQKISEIVKRHSARLRCISPVLLEGKKKTHKLREYKFRSSPDVQISKLRIT